MKKLLLSTGIALVFSASSAFAQDAEIVTVATADFSVLTEGSPENPVAFPSYGTGSFTSFFPSWTNSKGMQAGGQLLIPDGGYIRTPSSNLSGYSGMVRVTAKVKAMDDYGGIVRFSVGYSSSQSVTFFDNEWHDISLVMSGGSYSSYVRMEPSLSASGILVKSLTVEQSDAFFVAPVAIQPNKADGTSFTAKWNSVKGATAYYLDVYSYDDGKKQYVVNNLELAATATSYEVTGLDASKKYYYVVRATNGTGMSADSNEIEVIKVIYYLGAPTDVKVTTDGNTFTASWTGDIDAQEYIVTVDATRTLDSEQEADLLSEDFANITDGAIDDINFIISSNLDPYTKNPGWEGAELGKAAGYLVLTPYGGYDAYINTPVLDLSANGGKFTVSLNATIGAFGKYYDGTATVRLLDSEGNVLQTKDVAMTAGFADYKVEMTGGVNACRVSVLYNGDYKVFIDEMSVSQTLPAGATVTDRLLEATTDATSYTYTVEGDDLSDIVYTLTVTSAAETVLGTDIVPIYSDASEAVSFTLGQNVGIDSAAAERVVSRVYYNAAGVASATPHDGFNIEVSTLESGKTLSRRFIIRK